VLGPGPDHILDRPLEPRRARGEEELLEEGAGRFVHGGPRTVGKTKRGGAGGAAPVILRDPRPQWNACYGRAAAVHSVNSRQLPSSYSCQNSRTRVASSRNPKATGSSCGVKSWRTGQPNDRRSRPHASLRAVPMRSGPDLAPLAWACRATTRETRSPSN